MKKLLLLLTLLVTAVGSLCAETWTSTKTSAADWDAILTGSSKNTTTAPTKWTDTSNDLKAEFTFDYTWQTNSEYYSRGSNGLTFGSKNAGCKGLILKSSDIPGTVNSVKVMGAASNGSAKLSVKVNGVAYMEGTASSVALTTTATEHTFVGSESGEIEIMFADNADGKYISLNGISIEYTLAPATVGDISAKLNEGDVDLQKIPNLLVNDYFSFTAENAAYWYVEGSMNPTAKALYVQEDGQAIWAPDRPGHYIESVYAQLEEGKTDGQAFVNMTFDVESHGDIVGRNSDGVVIVSNSSRPNEEVGTTYEFSSKYADRMEIWVTGIDQPVASIRGSSISWTPDLGEYIVTVKAMRDFSSEDGSSTIYTKDLTFFTRINTFTTSLGTLTVKNGDEFVDYSDEVDSPVLFTDVLTFSCKNASHIIVTTTPGWGSVSEEFSGSSVNYPLSNLTLGHWEIYLTAYQGSDPDDPAYSTSRCIHLFINDPNPIGDIVMKANDVVIGKEKDELYNEIYSTIAVDTPITISAENADVLELTCDKLGLIQTPYTEPFVIDKAGKYTINVIARHSEYDYKITKQDYFLISVIELPTYVKVTSADMIRKDGTYILVGSTADAGKVGIMGKQSYDSKNSDNGYRLCENVTVDGVKTLPDSYKITESMDVTPFRLIANDQAYSLQLENGNCIAADSYSTSSVNMKEMAFQSKDKNGNDLTKFTVSLGENNEVTIKNGDAGNLISFNGGANPMRFKTYGAQQSPVYLYLLDIAPEFDQIVDNSSIVSFTSHKGELHIYLTERDEEGEVVKETELGENSPMRAAAANWTNMVAERGEEYFISVPSTEGNRLTIQAKTVLNGYHSEEIVRTINSDGDVVAGVEAVIANTADNAPVEYFNLQGVRVDGKTPGLYIRRQGSKVEKVLVK